MSDAAFRADFSDMKIIKTRKCVQWVYETPIEDMQKGLDAMGGPPHPGHSVSVAIARLDVSKVEKPVGKTPSQRAWLLCGSRHFRAWLYGDQRGRDRTDEEAAYVIRERLGITSRGELDTNPEARARFEQLEREYQEASR